MPATRTPRPVALLIAAATTVAAATALGALVAPAAASAVDVPGVPSAGSTVGPPVIIARAALPAGQRFVTATIRAKRASGSTARSLMLSATLTCGRESIQATKNIAGSGWLAPRRVMADATSCQVVAYSALGKRSIDRLQVTTTISSTALAWGVSGYQPTGFPTLVARGKAYDAVPVTWTPRPGTGHVRVQGDLKVTACTTVGGSRENGSPYLCQGRVDRSGTRLQASLVVQQMAAHGGGYCAAKTVSSSTVSVNKYLHHAMIYQSGTYTLSTSPLCSGTVRAKLYVRVLDGADLLVHRKGTISALYR